MRTFGGAALLCLFLVASEGRPGALPSPGGTAARDSLSRLADATDAANTFVLQWRYYWEMTEAYRRYAASRLSLGYRQPVFSNFTWGAPKGMRSLLPSSGDSAAILREWNAEVGPRGSERLGFDQQRRDYAVCYPNIPPRTPDLVIANHVIDSHVGAGPGARTSWAVCPTWYINAKATPWDEGDSLDAAIAGVWRKEVRERRQRLLDELARAAAEQPGDGWISGQRVRFAVDQGDTVVAHRALSECRMAGWWCAALDGYVQATRHEIVRADSMFGVALSQMTPLERCAWTDLSVLLDSVSAAEYSRVPCTARDSINDRLWWLADPLYAENGNERRVQHYARRMLAALRGATDYGEHWDVRNAGGGQAVATMIVRYGWPSFTYWPGAAQDAVFYREMRAVADPTFRRFATAEYGQPRYHTVPTWSTIANPTATQEAGFIPMSGNHYFLALSDSADWWPVEHAERHAGPIVQLWSQIGLFRRPDGPLLALAADLPLDGFPGGERDTLTGAFIFTAGPHLAATTAPAQGIVGRAMTLLVPVPASPQVVSLELFGRHPAGVAARTRFGVEPPPSLSTMRPGEIAIAPPVIVRPPDGDDAPSSDPATALARMQGPAISDWSRVGLYWETYGVHAGDTVDVQIRLDRDTLPPTDQRRLGYRATVGAGSTQVSFSWREPDPGHATTTINGAVPIQGRNITLDLSSIPSGRYTLVVSIARTGGDTVSAARDFQVR